MEALVGPARCGGGCRSRRGRGCGMPARRAPQLRQSQALLGAGLQPVAAAGAGPRGPGGCGDLAAACRESSPPPRHGHGAVGAEALPQLPAPPQGAAVDRGPGRAAACGSAPRAGIAGRG